MSDLIAVTFILAGSLLILVSNRYPVDTVLLGALCLLIVSGILTPAEAMTGYANPGIATFAVLYIVVSGRWIKRDGSNFLAKSIALGQAQQPDLSYNTFIVASSYYPYFDLFICKRISKSLD